MDSLIRILGKIHVTPPLNAAEIAVLEDLANPSRKSRCQWVPVDNGAALAWDGTHGFQKPSQWITKLIERYLGPEARAVAKGRRFAEFTFNHDCAGKAFVLEATYPKFWRMLVEDNKLYRTTYPIPTKGLPKTFDLKTGGEKVGAILELLSQDPTEGMAQLSRLLSVVTQVEDWLYLHSLFEFLGDFAFEQPEELRTRLQPFLAEEKKKAEARD